VTITGNLVAGNSAAIKMGTDAIAFGMNGGNSGSRSSGTANISSNGTVGSPLANTAGSVILVGCNGFADCTVTTNSNVIVANNTVASNGIGGGNGITATSADTPIMTWTINSNTIS